MATSPGQNELAAAMERIWAQFLPQMYERLGAIDAAVSALAAGNLTTAERAAANSAAHKLAGVLGTFGLTRGTVLAREAEMIFSSESENYEGVLPLLSEIAAQLRVLIEQHP